ncbi:hypothetical protein ACQPZK_20820 [Micromonospora sp. CA-249363]|uniref:hypothetical protein n=1 Tax=Micromonospora sp. CA-249363 TaxID=3239963 RepID=UPI003D8B24FF
MTAPRSDGCPDIKVIPLPAGGLVLTGRSMTQVEHPAELQRAIDLPTPADARLVVLLEEEPFSALAQRFFDGQAFRQQLVVVPGALSDGPVAESLATDPAPALRYAEVYGLQAQVPIDRIPGPPGGVPDGRFVPIDDQGRETGWTDATAVRVLPATHVAAREAIRVAVEIAGGAELDPGRRLRDLLDRLAGRPVPPPALAAAVHLVRHGLPDATDSAGLTASAMPVTTERLLRLVGEEPGLVAPFDPGAAQSGRRTDLPGLYADMPELLDEVDSITDLDDLVQGLTTSVREAVIRRMNATWRHALPGALLTVPDLSELTTALREDPLSFFPDGRSFDVRDGTLHWHRVSIRPDRDDAHAERVPQEEDHAKYDTRLDAALGERSVATVGVSGSIGVGALVPGRLGPGGGVAVESVLSRPIESIEASSKLTSSHNIRSGGRSHLVGAPTMFRVSVTDVRGPLTPPDATPGTPVTATVHYRAVDDIAVVTPGQQQEFEIGAHLTSLLVEKFTPLRILRAGFADEVADDGTGLTGWHDVQEELINRLYTTGTVQPGTMGANNVRDLLDRRSILSLLIPSLDGGAHPPTVRSRHGAHALSLELTATVPAGTPIGDIAKASFRTQPGLHATRKVTHTSRVGGGVSVVPLRWGLIGGYVQFRVFGGLVRSMAASASSSSQSRSGTEFKDIPDTLVALRFDVTVTPALRELPMTRMGSTGAVGPITLRLVVLGHLPTADLRHMKPRAAGAGAEQPAGPEQPAAAGPHVPPYAFTGGRSTTQGLSQFLQFSLDVQEFVRRFEGGFLPRFEEPTRIRHMYSSRAALERQHNRSMLDRVLTPAGRRQGQGSGLKAGQVIELTRTKKWGSRHIVIHVRERYTGQFTYRGIEKGVAVRTVRVDGEQHKVVAGRQVRIIGAVEGGVILRFLGSVTAALSLGGSAEGRFRLGRRGGASRAGQEIRLHGGTPDSAAFDNNLELTADVYAYSRHVAWDRHARLRVGRVYRQRLPRPGVGSRAVTAEQAPGPSGRPMTRFRMVETKPVTVLFDRSSVLAEAIDAPAVFEPRPDPLGVHRRTQLPLGTLRDWVDGLPPADAGSGRVRITDWLSVEAFPAGAHLIDLAKDAFLDLQRYTTGRVSRTKLHGLRGVDAMRDGMPVWAGLIGELGDEVQAATVRAMLVGHWQFDKFTPGDHGAASDLAMAASLFNAHVLAAYGTITTETATVSSVERDSVRTNEQQIVARAVGGVNVRKSGSVETSTSGGGTLFAAAVERLLWARSAQTGRTVFSAIERNRNNRKATVRSYLVRFDMRLSVAAEITTDPHRFRWWPSSLRTGSWLHHVKWARRDGIVRNAIYLRLPAAVADELGLLDRLDGDSGRAGAPWQPATRARVRLTDGVSLGSGIWNPRDAPDLSDRVARELARVARDPPPGTSWTEALTSAITFWDANGRAAARTARAESRATRSTIKAARTLSESLTADGLHDPMLNRRRLRYLTSAEGITRHLPSMADGGADVLHIEPSRLTQHPRDARLIATPLGPPRLDGFLADHDDLDVKFVSGAETSREVQRAQGHAITAGVSGTGISNHRGENLAAGLGDAVGHSRQVANAASAGSETLRSDLSSGRGVKARLTTPVRFSLVVFDRGEQIGNPLLTVDDEVTQDRWAGDLRLAYAPGTTIRAPAHYRVAAPAQLPPGWSLSNGMPLPARFVAEDLTQVAAIQATVGALLQGEARRLAKPGYAPTHLIHESITAEMLLPGVPKMLSADGLDLPTVTSTQIFGQKVGINVRLLPESASLGGLSSAVFREHARQNSGGVSATTNQRDQALRTPRVLFGRGYAEDAGQGVGLGGPGAVSGDAHILDDTQKVTGGLLGNVKPESRSAAVDYLGRVVVTLTLPRHLWDVFSGPRLVISPDTAERSMVRLRMGLHDARIAMHLPAEPDRAGSEQPGRVAAFSAVAEQEARLAAAANAFTTAAEALDDARYTAQAARDDPTARAGHEKRLPDLLTAWDDAGRTWWELAQEHWRLVDEFRHAYIGVSTEVTDPAGPGVVLQRISEAAVSATIVDPPRTASLREQIIDALKTPGAARDVEGVLVIGDEAGWAGREAALRAMLAAARAGDAPAILINGDALARAERAERAAAERAAQARAAQRENLPTDVSTGSPLDSELRALGAALRRYAAAEVEPVVYTTAATEGLSRLLETYRVVSVTGVSAGMDTAWQVTGPPGVAPGPLLPLGQAVSAQAAGRLVPLDVPPVPPKLATWLAAKDWPAASVYLGEQRADLRTPEVRDALDRLVRAEPGNRELRAYQVVLELADRPELTVALDHLNPAADVRQRGESTTRLLRSMVDRQITIAQAAALAEGRLARDGPPPGVAEVDTGRADAILLRAVGLLLDIAPERADDLTAENYRQALALIAGCVITATDKWLWLLRLKDLEADLPAEIVALLRVFSDRLASNC